ncbi:hypothetical protein KCP77_12695 [Salmonella enterica subsp. enterica]|nr:hypothetical protein KCP77_12695 [Salmonella enterica subsp. enterica]
MNPRSDDVWRTAEDNGKLTILQPATTRKKRKVVGICTVSGEAVFSFEQAFLL